MKPLLFVLFLSFPIFAQNNDIATEEDYQKVFETHLPQHKYDPETPRELPKISQEDRLKVVQKAVDAIFPYFILRLKALGYELAFDPEYIKLYLDSLLTHATLHYENQGLKTFFEALLGIEREKKLLEQSLERFSQVKLQNGFLTQEGLATIAELNRDLGGILWRIDAHLGPVFDQTSVDWTVQVEKNIETRVARMASSKKAPELKLEWINPEKIRISRWMFESIRTVLASELRILVERTLVKEPLQFKVLTQDGEVRLHTLNFAQDFGLRYDGKNDWRSRRQH